MNIHLNRRRFLVTAGAAASTVLGASLQCGFGAWGTLYAS